MNKIIDYDKNGFIINGKHEFLIGGEFHYFRVPAAMWEDRLQKMKTMGANLISVYIAWNLHEPVEGQQRWDGDYDLDRFLTLCQKYGLYVLIKPGPYICAELDFGGHPDWLIPKIAKGDFRIRTRDKGYLDLCRFWYESCARQIKKHLITNGGSIIAAQIENEYDHLIEYGEETITVDEAIEYFMFLRNVMDELGIDVPKFANEAEFLRGTGIIDTRTYYPNIPGLWWWEFERFEEKLLSSKLSQSDSPIMILELQAGWFSQVGEPTYCPGLEVVEGVSKSVFITGASIINYYMMVGGTTFPFIGARGDIVLGGQGNITSYDFGGAPIGESGEIHRDKYYWIKGFIRFAKEFSHIIAESDGKRYTQIVSGGENIAILDKDGGQLDPSLSKTYENFTTYEEGNSSGRFFFVRNAEDDEKLLTIKISRSLTGTEYIFKSTVFSKETRMFPIAFTLPGTNLTIGYSTSEILLSKKYGIKMAFVLSGKKNAKGETLLCIPVSGIEVLKGDIKILPHVGGSLVQYTHDEINIVKIENTYIFIVQDDFNGRIEELETGLLFHKTYYLQEISESFREIKLLLQIKENSDNLFCFFPFEETPDSAFLDEKKVDLESDGFGMLTVKFKVDEFEDKPRFRWASDWKYTSDSEEISESFDHSSWRNLSKPISLEEANILEHGYIWYRAQFDLDSEPRFALMDYKHNDTDRYLVYLNGKLIFRSRNKSIAGLDVAKVLKKGCNTLAVLYANEFHNKSHPHEGAIVKYSGVMNPIIITGEYEEGKTFKTVLKSFFVKQGLSGISKGFTRLEYNDSLWKSVPNAEKFVVAKNMGHIVWFRRHFEYDIDKKFSAPLKFIPVNADERLTIYVNGMSVARYDIIGPQQEFYIPDSYIKTSGGNVISVILECPGFYEELMSGFRRGYMCDPIITPSYISKKVMLELNYL